MVKVVYTIYMWLWASIEGGRNIGVAPHHFLLDIEVLAIWLKLRPARLHSFLVLLSPQYLYYYHGDEMKVVNKQMKLSPFSKMISLPLFGFFLQFSNLFLFSSQLVFSGWWVWWYIVWYHNEIPKFSYFNSLPWMYTLLDQTWLHWE